MIYLKRRNKYGEFDLCLDYRGVYSVECHSRVVGHYSTVIRNAIDRSASSLPLLFWQLLM